ncbi:MAG: hypothetical protein AB7O88_24360 [Reyranellaceae bacterium]
MPDTTYQPKVYLDQGGDRMVVASGGKVVVEEGGAIEGVGVAGSVAVAADVLAIPVTHAVVMKTTGADAEALTLANGTSGQILNIVLAEDGGGTGTLTPATKTGFSNIVFADAGDVAALRYVDDTVGWVLIGTAGVSAPPAITA